MERGSDNFSSSRFPWLITTWFVIKLTLKLHLGALTSFSAEGRTTQESKRGVVWALISNEWRAPQGQL